MGNFTELVISFEFKGDAPTEVISAVSSLAVPGTSRIPAPHPEIITRYDPYDSPPQQPFSRYDWGPFFRADMSGGRGGVCDAALIRRQMGGAWGLTARSIHKAYPEELVDGFLWLGPHACPHAEPDLPELCGYLKTEASDRPILIWNDGDSFVLEDLNPVPGEYH